MARQAREGRGEREREAVVVADTVTSPSPRKHQGEQAAIPVRLPFCHTSDAAGTEPLLHVPLPAVAAAGSARSKGAAAEGTREHASLQDAAREEGEEGEEKLETLPARTILW